jgi:hypothetical protein
MSINRRIACFAALGMVQANKVQGRTTHRNL